MASPFDAALAACDAVFDGTFGARVRITPMAGTANARPGLDPARPVWDGVGVPSATPVLVTPKDARGTGREDRFGTTSSVTRRTVSIARASLGAMDVVTGDRVSLRDEVGEPVFTVTHVDRDDPTRLVLHLDALP